MKKVADDGDEHHGPHVVDGGGHEILQVDGVAEERDGEQRDRRIRRVWIQHAVKDRAHQDCRESLPGAHHHHQDHGE